MTEAKLHRGRGNWASQSVEETCTEDVVQVVSLAMHSPVGHPSHLGHTGLVATHSGMPLATFRELQTHAMESSTLRTPHPLSTNKANERKRTEMLFVQLEARGVVVVCSGSKVTLAQRPVTKYNRSLLAQLPVLVFVLWQTVTTMQNSEQQVLDPMYA